MRAGSGPSTICVLNVAIVLRVERHNHLLSHPTVADTASDTLKV